MQLTNLAFMSSRQHYLDAQSSRKGAATKIATSRLDHSSGDTAAISQAGKVKSNIMSGKAYIQNLQSARSYLKFQEAGYASAFEIYQRMGELSSESIIQPKDSQNPLIKEFNELKKQLLEIKNSKFNGISVFDPVATCGDVVDIPVDGSALDYTSSDLAVSQTIRSKTVDVSSYGGTLSFKVNSGTTGEIYRVFMGDKELFSTGPSFSGNDPTVEVINIYDDWSTSSKISSNKGVVYNNQIYQNKTGANYIITPSSVTPDNDSVSVDFDPNRREQGPKWKNGNTINSGKGVTYNNELYKNISGSNFTINNSSTTPDLSPTSWTKVSWLDTGSQQSNIDSNGVLQSSNWGTDSWRTSGTASNGDGDTIVLKFGPGVDTAYSINLGASNGNQNFNTSTSPQSNLATEGGVIRIGNLDQNSTSTHLSLHVETGSIGVISDVEFIPEFFDKNLDVDTSGNHIALKAVGLDTLESYSINSTANARKTLNKLLGENGVSGEIQCVSSNWLPKIAASINRIDSELGNAESKIFNQEIALGRITSSDMALESTNQAKQMLKMDMAAFVMGKTTRINDILTPLTTNHHRSSIMSGSALL